MALDLVAQLAALLQTELQETPDRPARPTPPVADRALRSEAAALADSSPPEPRLPPSPPGHHRSIAALPAIVNPALASQSTAADDPVWANRDQASQAQDNQALDDQALALAEPALTPDPPDSPELSDRELDLLESFLASDVPVVPARPAIPVIDRPLVSGEIDRNSDPNLDQNLNRDSRSIDDLLGDRLTLDNAPFRPEAIDPKASPAETMTETIQHDQTIDQTSDRTREPASDRTESPQDDPFAVLQNLLVGSQVGTLDDRLEKLETRLADPTGVMTWLLPELEAAIAAAIGRSRQAIYQDIYDTLAHRIDEVMEARGREDLEGMSRAISQILPSAIRREIRQSPEAIAAAIGPEIAAAIRYQVQHEEGAISQAISTEIGMAIKQQIEVERDAMVDALYPIIGSTISKYMQEAVRKINEKVAESTSPKGLARKVRAKLQGVSTADLILSESLGFKIKAVFLVHKASGLPIADVQPMGDEQLETELLAGMLTAIRSFANDCIDQGTSPSEISEIDYGDSHILLEVAGYCYLAAIIQGQHPDWYVDRMRRVLTHLIMKYDRLIRNYDGDPNTIPSELTDQLMRLLVSAKDLKVARPAPPVLFGLLGVAVVGGFGFWAWNTLQTQERQRAIAAIEQTWYTTPSLSVYGLSVQTTADRLVLQGRLPSVWLNQEAERVARLALQKKKIDRPIVNQIVTVNVPPSPDETRAALNRTIAQFVPGRISADYRVDPAASTPGQGPVGLVVLRGQFRDTAEAKTVTEAIARLPGVRAVVPAAPIDRPLNDIRFYFPPGSASLAPPDAPIKLDPLAQLLRDRPDLTLSIVGYSLLDEPLVQPGITVTDLARQRAEVVRKGLIDRGIAPNRVAIVVHVGRPDNVGATEPDWLAKCAIATLNLKAPAP